MIPVSVTVKGWMRYRDECVADFSNAGLIAICGENGAGKSSIFDAILFALYGEHRLGKQNTDQLIATGADRAEVSFEFEADGRRYRVTRGRNRKGRSDFGMAQWDEGLADYRPIPGCEREDNLQRAIDRVVRLPANAFKASFMLQQDAATAFIDTDPKKRFELVAGLIGLEEYEALADAAKKFASRLGGRLDDYDAELRGLEGNTPAALEARVQELNEAEKAERRAADAHLGARRRRDDAGRYADLRGQLEAIERRLSETAALLEQRATIERRAALFEAAAATQRVLRGMVEARDRATEKDRLSAAQQARADALDLAAAERGLDESRKAENAAEERRAAAALLSAEARTAEASAEQFRRVAGDVLAFRERLLGLVQDITELQKGLGKLPELRERLAKIIAIREALPALRELRAARADVERLRARDPENALERARAEEATSEGACTAAESARDSAEVARQDARERGAAATAAARHTAELVEARKSSAGEAVCSRCGQHIDAARAKQELTELKAQLDAHAKSQKEALVKLERLETQYRELDTAVTTARERHRKLLVERTRLEGDVETYRVAVRRDAERQAHFLEVAPGGLAKLAGPQATVAEIDALLERCRRAPEDERACREQIGELEQGQGRLDALRAERTRTEAGLAEAEARAGARLVEVEQAKELHAAAAAALTAAEGDERDAADACEAARNAVREAGVLLDEARRVRSEAEAAARVAAGEAATERRFAEALAGGLPEGDRAAALADPAAALLRVESELGELAGALDARERLREAEQRHAADTALRVARREDIELIPTGHRVPVGEAEAALVTAAEDEAAARRHREAAYEAKVAVEKALDEVERIRRQQASLQHRRRLAVRLGDLVGRSGLQGALVTSAMASIKNSANAFLERLTGGSLRLELEPRASKGKETDELELKAIDTTCMTEARPVKSLSGSQKFRVSVALASGIGQYAGAGGMRSIIIDEGFGSLDLPSQRQMVRELKELATHMDRVIVVSHLEAFAEEENFPTRLLVRRRNGTSTITRYG